MNFRPDINALRALAVTSVVFYHFFPMELTGGFAGVDIFFVISGYLMTRIIFTKFNEGNFSYRAFYIARANRIVPALVVMILITLVAGFLTLSPFELKSLGKHALKSILFVSNQTYLKEAGYFDAASLDKWLLHTWSLSVEWQFYIIYPIVIGVLFRTLTYRATKIALLMMCISSFFYSLHIVKHAPNSAYYLLSSRSWEMLLGGVAFLYPITLKEKNIKVTLSVLGLCLIIASFIYIDSSLIWPSYYTLPATLGTFLIISVNLQYKHIYDNQVVSTIGKSSYSIYLWHWPILVWGSYWQIPYWQQFGLAISAVFGIFSAKYIETLSYSPPRLLTVQVIKYPPLFLALITIVVSQVIYSSNGLFSLYPEKIQVISKEVTNRNPRKNECHLESGIVPECTYGTGEVEQIVLGDSHAASIVRSVEKAFPHSATLDWTMSGCRTAFGIYNTRSALPDYSCGTFINSLPEKLQNYPKASIYILNRYASLIHGANERDDEHITEFFAEKEKLNQRDNAYSKQALDSIYSTICTLSTYNPVFVIDPIPELKKHVPKSMAKELRRGNGNFRVSIPLKEYQHRNDEVFTMLNKLEKNCRVTRVHVQDLFCDASRCFGDKNGRPIYFDDNHLSEYGAGYLIPRIQALSLK